MIFNEFIEDQFEKEKKNFDNNCDLLIFDLSNNDLVNILNNENLNKELIDCLYDFKKLMSLKEYYYFKDKISMDETSAISPGKSISHMIDRFYPELYPYFYKSNNQYFLYIIFEHNNLIQDHKKLEEIIIKIKNLLKQFSIKHRVISSLHCHSCTEIKFHAICKNIYSIYKVKEKPVEKFKKDGKAIIESIPSTMKIKDFIEYLNKSISEIWSDLDKLAKFQQEIDEDLQNLRTEYIAIAAYLQKNNINIDLNIELGKKDKRWDAKINLKDKDLILEITQAVPSNEHLTRYHLSNYMYGVKGFPFNLRKKYQFGLDEFPLKIIKTINKKHKKNYTDNRVLIVIVLFEFAYNEESMVKYWIDKVSKESQKGTFSEIWLAFDAEQLVKIH